MFGLGALRRAATAAIGPRMNSTVAGPAAAGRADSKQFAQTLSSRIHNIEVQQVGRSVPVMAGGARQAYDRLNRILSQNRIRQEKMRRRRYEKPTYKRQRLRREGHARRFKEEVRQKVHLVYKMKRLGE
ncbi:hypothetical protein GGF46_000847 [Coemansia sp. RSA 552]|nr:hypothetical protein GGF46_000847 [Coemansia sp. RSA 552]